MGHSANGTLRLPARYGFPCVSERFMASQDPRVLHSSWRAVKIRVFVRYRMRDAAF